MSKASDPMTTLFDAQRAAITQTHEFARRSIELQREAVTGFVDSLEMGRRAGRTGSDLAASAVAAWFAAIESAVPGDTHAFEEMERAVEEQLAAMEEMGDESWTAVREILEDNAEAFDEIAETYVESLDASFEAFLEAVEGAEGQVARAAEAVEIDVETEAEE